ncbi:hypothetical protein [uncultured Arcobacter sp.]|uniref:hypothetical protein n=1 Tax=uncultured Arcobacter sp. TaxID=165434 RepID=UPI0026027F2F|nr:hypothetical protein [uncultured Arcobacter sp.]
MANIFLKPEKKVPYNAGTQESVALSRNFFVQNLLCKLKVTHTNSSAVFKDEALYSLINNVEVVANGSLTIKQMPSSKFHITNLKSTGKKGNQSIITADGADKESYVWFMIPFSMPRTVRAHDTILNTKLFTNLDLIVNWGSDATIGTGITVTDAEIEVYSNALVNFTGNDANTTETLFRETSASKEVTSSTNEMTFELPVGKLYKALDIVATVDGIRSNSVINNIKIHSGTTTFVDLPAEAIRAGNVFETGLTVPSDLNGIHLIDFMPRGRVTDALNTSGVYNTLTVTLDVTKQSGLNKILLLSETLQSVPKPAK